MKVRFKASFVKDLKNSNPEIANRVQQLIEQVELVESIDLISNIKKLKNSKNYYRIRIGDYRIGTHLEIAYLKLEEQIMATITEYEKDFYAWLIKNAQLIRNQQFSEIDAEQIAEELESIGRSEKRELISRLTVLLAHLLKWQFQNQ